MSLDVSEQDDPTTPLINAIRAVRDRCDADIILYSGDISRDGDKKLIDAVKRSRKRPNVFLHLTTLGGDPDAAYRIARCLQRTYKGGRFSLFIDGWCKSAGTLIAIGADEISMTDMAELGPLDIQLMKPDEFAEQTSGLTPRQALSTLRESAQESLRRSFLDLRFGTGLQITTRTALDVATKLTTGLFAPIFEQIDPMRFGEIQRAMQIARQYGERLSSENENGPAIRPLIENYPSHGFVIDRAEAEKLFGAVRKPTEAEEAFSAMVQGYVEFGLASESPVVEMLSNLVPEGSAIQTRDAIAENGAPGDEDEDANDAGGISSGATEDSPADDATNGAPPADACQAEGSAT